MNRTGSTAITHVCTAYCNCSVYICRKLKLNTINKIGKICRQTFIVLSAPPVIRCVPVWSNVEQKRLLQLQGTEVEGYLPYFGKASPWHSLKMPNLPAGKRLLSIDGHRVGDSVVPAEAEQRKHEFGPLFACHRMLTCCDQNIKRWL
jgi:hypothetical protein